MNRVRSLLVALIAVVVMAGTFTSVPAQAAPPPQTVAVKRMDVDWGWYKATVWYSKYETQRIVATNGACSVVVGKAPGWVAKILSGACGLIAVWAGYALARDRCVGVKVSYFMALPYGWDTRAC
jgi:hypothetical protein